MCDRVKNFHAKYVDFLQKYISSILLVLIRVWIGLIFLRSGLVKFSNLDQTAFLFEYEYGFILFTPIFTAILSAVVEASCGAALLVGLLSRIAALPLIALVCVIQFFVFQNIEHFYWLFLLSTLAIYGSGCFSVDGLLRRFVCKK